MVEGTSAVGGAQASRYSTSDEGMLNDEALPAMNSRFSGGNSGLQIVEILSGFNQQRGADNRQLCFFH
jgi:hypothetical protein